MKITSFTLLNKQFLFEIWIGNFIFQKSVFNWKWKTKSDRGTRGGRSKLKGRNIRSAVCWDVLCRSSSFIWLVSFVLGMLLSASLAAGELTVSLHCQCFAKDANSSCQVEVPVLLTFLCCMQHRCVLKW